MASLAQLQLANSENIAIVYGVTDGTQDTALATLPPNPFKNKNVLAIPIGEGCYIEDDGSVQPRQSGVLAATIDIRSTLVSKYFTCICINLGPGQALTRDHSAVTT